MNSYLANVAAILAWLIPALLAIVGHELAHGYTARACGDFTAEAMGRLSPNPFAHLHPVGSIALPLALYALGMPALGWARPMPIDFHMLRNRMRDTYLVLFAGPAANLVMAGAWWTVAPLWPAAAHAGVLVNLAMAALNLLPIPPLDGGRALQLALAQLARSRAGP